MCVEQLLFKILFYFKKLFPFALGISHPGNFPVVSCPTFSQSNIASVHERVKVGGFVFENKSCEIF